MPGVSNYKVGYKVGAMIENKNDKTQQQHDYDVARSKECRMKRRYESRALAEESIRRVREVRPELLLRAYQCPICEWFHLTQRFPSGE